MRCIVRKFTIVFSRRKCGNQSSTGCDRMSQRRLGAPPESGRRVGVAPLLRASAFGSLKLRESSVDHAHGDSALTDRGSNPFDVSCTDITHSEYSRQAGATRHRRAKRRCCA